MTPGIHPTRPPVPNRAARPIDFSEIDTPEEAILSPGADLWTGLVLGPLAGKVSITAGDQSLHYEIHPQKDHLIYLGEMNGERFVMEGRSERPRGIRFEGQTPGGWISSLRRGGGRGFGLDGTAGAVEFSQLLALDRSGGTSGSLAFLGGTVGGEKLEARARKGDGGTVEVSGTLGDKELKQTISLGSNDEWIVKGQLGSESYTQVIERFT